MPPERPVSAGAELGRRILVNLVPGLRARRVRTEQARIAVQEKAQQARESLDSAYFQLGGESGKDVAIEQIGEVLNAELEVLRTSLSPDPLHLIFNEVWFSKALELHTKEGVFYAASIFSKKADNFRDIAHNISVPGSEEEHHEAQRRVIACVSAKELLYVRYREIDALP